MNEHEGIDLVARLESVNRRIMDASKRAGRSATDITLVGVTKTIPEALIRKAIEAGLKVIGENRVQEAATKIPGLSETCAEYDVSWHFIGHLQSNKARRALELFDCIESVDSLKLAERLNSIAGETGRRLPVLIEVNLGEEESKSGVSGGEVLETCEKVDRLDHLELLGLMTVPPFLDQLEEVRPYFRRLRELKDEAKRTGIVGAQFQHLSMGMSHDFEVAIEEGATMVRIGTAIFGPRA